MALTTVRSTGIGSLPAISGANLTSLNASNISSGTLNSARFDGGKILQVKQGTTQTQVEQSLSSETSLGLAVSITPTSSSNKILIFIQAGGCGTRDTSTYWKLTLNRDTTDIHNVASYIGNSANSGEEMYPNGVFLDSPSSTSSISYNLTGIRTNGSGNCYFLHNASSPNITTATITAMEISV